MLQRKFTPKVLLCLGQVGHPTLKPNIESKTPKVRIFVGEFNSSWAVDGSDS